VGFKLSSILFPGFGFDEAGRLFTISMIIMNLEVLNQNGPMTNSSMDPPHLNLPGF
jgi:hypothetical protein